MKAPDSWTRHLEVAFARAQQAPVNEPAAISPSYDLPFFGPLSYPGPRMGCLQAYQQSRRRCRLGVEALSVRLPAAFGLCPLLQKLRSEERRVGKEC